MLRDFCSRCRSRLLWSGGHKICANKECLNYGKRDTEDAR